MHARVLRLQTQHTGMHKKPASENHLYLATTRQLLPFCTTPVRAILTAVKSKQYDDFRTENRSIPSILETEMLVRVHKYGLCGFDILKIVQRRYIFKLQENKHGKYTL